MLHQSRTRSRAGSRSNQGRSNQRLSPTLGFALGLVNLGPVDLLQAGPSGFLASRVQFCYWAQSSLGARAHRVRLVGPVPRGTWAFRASASHVLVPLVLVLASDESLSGGNLSGPQRTLYALAKDPKRAV